MIKKTPEERLKTLINMESEVIDEFDETTFKIVKRNNELIIESTLRGLYNDEKELFMKYFSDGILKIKGKNYNIINTKNNEE